MKHIFDWHKEDQDSFLGWMIVNLVTEMREENAFDEFSKLTDKFQNIELGITINGRPVATKEFVDRLEQMFERSAKDEARKMLSNVEEFDRIKDLLYGLEEKIRSLHFTLDDKLESIVNTSL